LMMMVNLVFRVQVYIIIIRERN